MLLADWLVWTALSNRCLTTYSAKGHGLLQCNLCRARHGALYDANGLAVGPSDGGIPFDYANNALLYLPSGTAPGAQRTRLAGMGDRRCGEQLVLPIRRGVFAVHQHNAMNTAVATLPHLCRPG